MNDPFAIAVPPFQRFRRLRRTPALRRLVQETRLHPADFILPFFVTHGFDVHEEIGAMPGVSHLSVDRLPRAVEEAVNAGVTSILLFGLPETKDGGASEAFADDGIVQQAVRRIKADFPAVVVITDVCLCAYTDHGHCGLLTDHGTIDNDTTLPVLARVALSHAEAGADIVAPSDMMDGRIAAIRTTLDDRGFTETPIMAYSAKFASAFYGPFREAAHSAPSHGDRRSHQMDPANGREALREIAADIAEGADIVMVKPAMPYLDVLAQARAAFDLPITAYQVSGEYAMLKNAAQHGLLDERRAMLEALTSIKRAGADSIITYAAVDAARWLAEEWGGALRALPTPSLTD
ncbi:MAG: porphobilinogen synthase [Thermomicrobiales bacterium]